MRSAVRRLEQDERGMTLVEILAAVTIMAIISVAIISKFVAAMDKSSEESRRIIASNLARLKAAEIRSMSKLTDVDVQNPPRSNFDLLRVDIGGVKTTFDYSTHPLPSTFRTVPAYIDLLKPAVVNGTEYDYEVTFEPEGFSDARKSQLTSEMNLSHAAAGAGGYLIRMWVKVSWDPQQDGTPKAAKFTTLDTYIMNKR
jgi:prepilin-type N-terminal cleavage/methylation domain-containing protein